MKDEQGREFVYVRVYKCPECPKFRDGAGYGEDYCTITDKYEGEITTNRGVSSWCPLRELEINKE